MASNRTGSWKSSRRVTFGLSPEPMEDIQAVPVFPSLMLAGELLVELQVFEQSLVSGIQKKSPSVHWEVA